MEITVTEALVQLKLLKNRIEKEIGNSVFIMTSKVNTAPVGFSSKEAFMDKAKSSYQSITDLIANRNKLKAAIVKSNASAMITIAGVTYSVAEAIERKTSIVFEQQLLSRLVQQNTSASNMAEKANQQAQSNLDRLIEISCGKEKSDSASIKPLSDNFWATNKTEIIDPLSIILQIEKVRNDMDSFLAEVDIRLTISNSTTIIEI